MAAEKVAGTDLLFGVTATGIQGVHEQNQTKSAKGEVKFYKDKDGDVISAYVFDKHTEISGECLVETSAAEKEVGESCTIGDVTGIVTQWDVVESNEDVAKIRFTVRTTDIASSAGGGSSAGSGT